MRVNAVAPIDTTFDYEEFTNFWLFVWHSIMRKSTVLALYIEFKEEERRKKKEERRKKKEERRKKKEERRKKKKEERRRREK